MGTFVASPQCGSGRDHLKSGSSTEDDLSLQLGDEPKPGAVFFSNAVIVSVFERRSAPHDQRRAVASAFRSSTLVISLS